MHMVLAGKSEFHEQRPIGIANMDTKPWPESGKA